MNQWIVMTSSAHMPSSCKGNYRRVALVKLTVDYAEQGRVPKLISDHAQGVLEVRDMGNHSVGKTQRSAYYKAVEYAEARAAQLNNPAKGQDQ